MGRCRLAMPWKAPPRDLGVRARSSDDRQDVSPRSGRPHAAQDGASTARRHRLTRLADLSANISLLAGGLTVASIVLFYILEPRTRWPGTVCEGSGTYYALVSFV
jgi:hypothetical protein